MIARLTILVCALVCAGARADAPPDELTWDELAQRLTTAGPREARWSAAVDEARAEAAQAEALDNPTLAYLGYGRTRGTSQAINGSQHQLELEQRLPRWGERRLRTEAARHAQTARALQNEEDKRRLLGEARQVFVALLFAQERAARLEAAGARMAELTELIRGRVAAGLFSQYELTRAELERSRLSLALENARADEITLQGEIATLLLRPGYRPRARGELAVPNLPWPDDASLAETPTRARVEAERAASDASLRADERARYPELRLQAGAYFTTSGDSASVLGGLSLTLPSFDTGRAAVARSRARRAAVEGLRDLVRLDGSARLDAARAELAQRQRAYEAFAQTIPAQSATLRDMADASYRGGRVSAFVLLDTARDLLAAELEGLATLEALVLADAALRSAAGQTRFQ